MTTSTRTWVAGTAGAVVLILLAAWFLLIGPQRAEAEVLAADAASAEAANDVLAASVQRLRSDFVELPDDRAELAAARQALPADLALSTLTRQAASAADQAGVRLMSLAPSAPGSLDTASAAPVAGEETAAEPAEGAVAAEPAGAAEPASTAEPAAAAVPGGPVPTPVQIQVVGGLARAQLFLQELQTGTRDLLVTDLALVAEQPAEASGGKPATENGDVTLTVTALVFVLPDAAGETTTALDTAAAAPATEPSNGESR